MKKIPYVKYKDTPLSDVIQAKVKWNRRNGIR
jgi:hypothetical protein